MSRAHEPIIAHQTSTSRPSHRPTPPVRWARYLAVYNEVRPHEALDFARPLDRYLRRPSIGRHGLIIGPCS